MTDDADDFPGNDAAPTRQTQDRDDRHPASEPHRRIPPHGDVSPDGQHIWPRPSLSAKILVWGGTALAVAGATAGAVIAARHVADLVGGDKRQPDQPQPRRDTIRPARFVDAPHHDRPTPRPRPKRRAPKSDLMRDIETNSQRLTHSVDGVIGSLTAAMSGFLGVARQAGTIMRDFGDAAEMIRTVMDHNPKDTKPAPDRDHPGDGDRPADQDPRTHRL